ncbi:MAG: hypothetical protein LM523_12540 [Candidatus Contendobacter sp.]|nr:hypothetical protein [Candidatus Contendobacter sp.]
MNAIRVDAGRGWGWITEGWRLFARAPGVWIVILLIYSGISVVLSLIPLIGMLAYPLLSPVLTGGVLYGADKQARGETLEIGDLFRGFQDQGRMGPLVILGLISLAGYMLMGLILMVFVGGGIATGIVLDDPGQGITPEMIEGLFGVGFMVLMLVELTLWAVIMMAMLYAIPLVMLGRQDAWPAVQDSIAACWINMLPLLVFGLMGLVLAMIAAIPFGLGFLILWPVMACAVYASYREVFAEPTPTRVTLRK